MNTQTVYFDRDDEAMDGYGWNVVDYGTDTGVAARFATVAEAIAFCENNGFTFEVIRPFPHYTEGDSCPVCPDTLVEEQGQVRCLSCGVEAGRGFASEEGSHAR